MLYKFKSKASGDVIMMGPTGDALLRALGHSPALKGIIEVADMPAAIAAIEQAVAADEAARPPAADDSDADRDSTAPGRDGVGLRQRLWPMVDMLRRCAAAGEPVVWGV